MQAKRDHGRVSDPLAGMIWHIAGPPDFLSARAEQPARVSVLTPRPGFLFAGSPYARSMSWVVRSLNDRSSRLHVWS
jgi:hypothetical protein